MVGEPDATMQPTLQDNQLMSKHRVLSFKPQLRLEWRGQDGQSETEQPDHSASLGDSITSSTQIRFSVHTGPAFASSICNCMFASFGSERIMRAGSCGSAAATDGALTGTAIEAGGNERPAANPATTAIPTVATLRSSRRFT